MTTATFSTTAERLPSRGKYSAPLAPMTPEQSQELERIVSSLESGATFEEAVTK